MKTILTTLATLFLFHVNAQMMYLTYGYNGTFTNLSGINSVVDNYNETRPWLSDEMGHFNYLDGFSANIGFGVAKMWFELGYDFRSQVKSASGVDASGAYNTRELKIKSGAPQFTLGFFTNIGNRSALGIGTRLEFGSIKAKTRVYGDYIEKDGFESMGVRYGVARIGPTVKLLSNVGDNGFTITLSAFYMFNFSASDQNVWDLDEKLNNTEYMGEYPEYFNLKSNCFGLSLGLGFAGSE